MSSSKKLLLSLAIVLFWSFTIYQVIGYREDWPFTRYGMYAGKVSAIGYSFVHMEYLTNQREWERMDLLISPDLFDIDQRLYELYQDHNSQNEEAFRSYFEKGLRARMAKRPHLLGKVSTPLEFRIKRKYWKQFSLGAHEDPDRLTLLSHWSVEIEK